MPRRPAKKSKRISKKRQQGFSWKLLFKSKKSKQRAYRVGVAVVLLFLSLTFLGGLFAYKIVTKTFVSADSTTSYDITNANLITLAIVSVDDIAQRPVRADSVHFVLVDKVKKKVVSYEVPLNLEQDIPGKFGIEAYSKIMPLGMLETEELEDGATLLTESLKKTFGLNVDRYLVVDSSLREPILNTFIRGEGNGLLNYDTLQNLIFNSKTNGSLSEFYNLFSFVRSLPSDRFINVPTSVDYFVQAGALDGGVRDLTFESALAAEKASIAVLNGSGASGVAAVAARAVQNMGGHVLHVGNAADTYEESMLVVSSMELEAVGELTRYFGVPVAVLKDRSGVSESVVDRVDVTLIIGLDKGNSL